MTQAKNTALSLQRIFASPDINGTVPIQARWSPDGKLVTYLTSKNSNFEQLHLHAFDIATGSTRLLVDADQLDTATPLSDAEKANRERRRVTSSGIVEYDWSPTGNHLLFPINGTLYLYHVASGGVDAVTGPGRFVTMPRFSPDGDQLAFIDTGDLYRVDLRSTKEYRLTTRRDPAVTNGAADFIAQEEMHRFDGYWWSPDSTKIAFIEVDESPVEITQRFEIEADHFGVIDQRYPYAGAVNAISRLAVADVATGEIAWLDAGIPEDGYLARVNWFDNDRLVTQTQSRLQDRLTVNLITLANQTTTEVLTETSTAWINLHDDFSARGDNQFLWRSDRDGFSHLYEVNLSGAEPKQLTEGPWCVHGLKCCTDTHLYFEAFADTPLEKHLYRRSWTGGKIERLTESGQFHSTVVSPDGAYYIDTVSAPDLPPTLSLVCVDDPVVKDIVSNRLAPGHPFTPYYNNKQQIQFGEIEAEDGQQLQYRLIPPLDVRPDQQYPVIVTVYGGPGAQLVTRQWLSPWQRYMAGRGYGMFQLDNRGSANRGTRFEHAIHLTLGDVEVRDQLRGVRWLKTQPWVNPERIAVFGHSYGGYMTLKLMSSAASPFAAGVSVAPVTDWSLYDTHYTERYLGMPEVNTSGYQNSSVFPDVKNLQGRLLVIHGMADDNVLFTNSTRLFKVLQDENIQFDIMTYPGAKHGLAGKQVNIHRYSMMDQFFDEHLKSS